jgi:hypothetical protein
MNKTVTLVRTAVTDWCLREWEVLR